MNISKVKSLLVAAALTTTSLASAKDSRTYHANENSIESKLCVAAASALRPHFNVMVDKISPSKFRNKKYRLVANKLHCNGMNVADFAAQAGNIDVANKLQSYRNSNLEIRDIVASYKGSVSVSG
jgi:hypothetical protein